MKKPFTQIVNTEASGRLTQKKLEETIRAIFEPSPMKVRYTCPVCGKIYSSIDPSEIECTCTGALFNT